MANKLSNARLPRWSFGAEAECTIVRLGNEWRDQSIETGHRFRPEDIDHIADLGVRRVRFPIIWESVAPDRPTSSTSNGPTIASPCFASAASK
jgi:hypothetical protein